MFKLILKLEKEAMNKAIEEAINKVQLKMGKEDTIISQKVLQKNLIDSTMDIDIFIVAEEQIGYQSEVKEEQANDL